MKKTTLTLLTTALLLTACGSNEKKNETANACTKLTIFNATEYMKEDLYKKFAKDNNIEVIYDTFDSNETMYTKFSSGATNYDIIIPSDYMIQNLIEKDLIQKIDKTKIPNAKGFFKSVSSPTYDPNQEYSLPYMWGTVGLVYNSKTVDLQDLESQGWGILKNPKYKGKIFMYDSERDGFMVAFKNLGFSLNSSDKTEIEKANQWLHELNAITEPVYVTDQIQDLMVSGEKDIAIGYSGDANLIISGNEDMKYFTPKEGTNLWIDGFVIPKNSKCVDLAYQFINYFLDSEVMKENAAHIGYTPSIEESAKALAKDEFKNIETFIPETRENDEVFKHNDTVKKTLSELWLKIKVK